MATATEARVNLVMLDRFADLFFAGDNAFVPFGSCSAKDLPATLESVGADRIVVEYRTVSDPKGRARDEAKFSKRLVGLGPGWVRTAWAPRVIRGFVQPNTMECVLTREAGR